MIFDVILLKEKENGYIARPLLWPDSATHGATEQEALERVHILIRDLFSRTRLVQVDVDVPNDEENPWVSEAGIFADDPQWDGFIASMLQFRQQTNESEIADLV